MLFFLTSLGRLKNVPLINKNYLRQYIRGFSSCGQGNPIAVKYSSIWRVPPVYTTSPRHRYRTLSRKGKTSDLGFSIVRITAVPYFFAAFDRIEITRYVFSGSRSHVGSSNNRITTKTQHQYKFQVFGNSFLVFKLFNFQPCLPGSFISCTPIISLLYSLFVKYSVHLLATCDSAKSAITCFTLDFFRQPVSYKIVVCQHHRENKISIYKIFCCTIFFAVLF